MKNIETIEAALERLMERRNDDAFLIIENEETGKFVQFAGGAAQSLVFDLPAQALTSDELARAMIVLAAFDVGFEGSPTGGGFSKEIGRDAAMGARMAWAVLTEVYLKLALEEN